MSNRTKLRRGSTGSPPTRSRVVPVVLAFLAGALAAGLIAAAVTRDSSPTADRVAELRAEEAQRDARQIVELTDQARRTREALLPVLDGLAAALPPGRTPDPAATPGTAVTPGAGATPDGATSGPAVDAAAARGWQTTTGKAVEAFAAPPSGGTGLNIARSGLSAAVRQLDLAVATYAAALTVPDARRPELLAIAARQRDTAVATWSTAATQLDVLNIDAGHGHTHVFLPAAPGQGALTADDAHEGAN
ncbi:hypothetical protein ABZ671_31440 [Micromonospora sp. NPDC006766]|uniref:hypothetical protein n=1 Tax=Micromonospora sp. NPDC006766 TaxID=3154778 RepID=UPI00340F50CB